MRPRSRPTWWPGPGTSRAGGVYQLRAGVDPAGAIPPKLIVGAWAVDPSGRPTGEFIPNPHHTGAVLMTIADSCVVPAAPEGDSHSDCCV